MYKYVVEYLDNDVTIEKREVFKENCLFIAFVDNPALGISKEAKGWGIFDSYEEAKSAALSKMEFYKNIAEKKVSEIEKRQHEIENIKEEEL